MQRTAFHASPSPWFLEIHTVAVASQLPHPKWCGRTAYKSRPRPALFAPAAPLSILASTSRAVRIAAAPPTTTYASPRLVRRRSAMTRPSGRRILLIALSLAIAPLAWLPSGVEAYRSSPHYGSGRRIPMDSIKTLTFYDGKKTAYRRTDPVPQLKCVGSPCRRFQPDVVQCTSMGDAQWKCSADLPPSIRMGRVDVSCEGYDAPSDPYVLKDSCALTYHLLPSYGPDESSRSQYKFAPSKLEETVSELVAWVFWAAFWAALLYIVLGFIRSATGSGRNGTRFSGGRGGGGPGGGGGGGGWGGDWGGWFPGAPGGGGGGAPPPPPPPYSKYDPSDASSSSGTGWRPGFWTGLGLGGLAAGWAANRAGARDRGEEMRYRGGGGRVFGMPDAATYLHRPYRRFDEDDDDCYGGGWGGNRGVGGSGSSAFGGGGSSPGSLRTSTGFGGTNNR
ncbi:hypothetical protein ACQY0O_004038 [Thecaphora frezii]